MHPSNPVLVSAPPLSPIGRLYGEPIGEIPADLFIPPDALTIFLEAFEGPLDLLLYLIRKHNLDVLDIPMAKLAGQYMAYVDAMRTHQLELAADYLLMAAVLIEIKSRMLLPRPVRSTQSEEDPRAELVRRLLDYEQMKKAAKKLDEFPLSGRDFLPISISIEQVTRERLPQVVSEDLRIAWLGLLDRARTTQHLRVTRDQLSVRERMSALLRRLHSRDFIQFVDLFEPPRGLAQLVVTFLALLELARESLIEITQGAPFSPIYVRLKDGYNG